MTTRFRSPGRRLSGLLLLVSLVVWPAAALAGSGCPSLPLVTYQGGEIDDLAPPDDPASRSTHLEESFPDAPWKDFDDTAIDRFWGHSFLGLPASVVAAEVELRARPDSFGAFNDILYLGLDGDGTLSFGTPIADLPEAGGDWDPTHQPDPVTFTLDLDALPSGDSILDQVATERRLDLLIQDDTSVDYVVLRVWLDPMTTYRLGLMDDYAAPADPSQRSAALEAAVGIAWKDLDDGTSNRGIGHTFTGLPSGITEATLEFRLRPHSDVPSNDSINLGLTPGGASTFAWGESIADLPEAGGVWSGNGPTVFTLDLDNLPGGVSLLADMSADGFLDLYIQDDSDLDYAKLRLRSCPPRRPFGGLDHVALGAAELSQTTFSGAGEVIEISNMGSSFTDGGRVYLGESKGWGFTLVDPLDQVNTARSWTMRGKVDGLFDQPIFTETIDVVAGAPHPTVRVFQDNSAVGATQIEGTFYDDAGNLLATRVFDNGLLYEFQNGDDPPPPIVAQWDATCVKLPIPPIPAVTLVDGTVLSDVARIETRALDATKSVEFCSAVDSLGLELAQAHLADEVLVAFEQRHAGRALGGARLEAFSGALTVSDLGIEGRTGVELGFDDADAAMLELSPVDPQATAPVGAFLRVEATGSVGGQLGKLGTGVVTKVAATSFEIATDFSDIGTDQQRVQVFDDGALVTELVVPTGVAGTADRWPDGLGKLGGTTECYVMTFDEDITFAFAASPAEGGGVSGDEIRLLAEGGQPVLAKSAIALYGAHLGDFTIENAETSPLPLFADGFESGDTSMWSLTQP